MCLSFGMPTLLELKSLKENIELCKALNLQFVEVNMNLPYCLPKNNDNNQIAKLLEDHGVGITIHLPEEMDVATPFDCYRRANIELFRDIALWGSQVKCEKIVMHVHQGVYFTLPERKVYLYETDAAAFSESAVLELNKMAEIAASYGILLCIENTVTTEVSRSIFQGLLHNQSIGFAWDVGHDRRDENKAMAFLSDHLNRIKHMHLHDCDGHQDHLTLYDGNFNIEDMVGFATKHNLSVVVEVKTIAALKESVKRLKDNNLI